jgi:hypothetical protein
MFIRTYAGGPQSGAGQIANTNAPAQLPATSTPRGIRASAAKIRESSRCSPKAATAQRRGGAIDHGHLGDPRLLRPADAARSPRPRRDSPRIHDLRVLAAGRRPSTAVGAADSRRSRGRYYSPERRVRRRRSRERGARQVVAVPEAGRQIPAAGDDLKPDLAVRARRLPSSVERGAPRLSFRSNEPTGASLAVRNGVLPYCARSTPASSHCLVC